MYISGETGAVSSSLPMNAGDVASKCWRSSINTGHLRFSSTETFHLITVAIAQVQYKPTECYLSENVINLAKVLLDFKYKLELKNNNQNALKENRPLTLSSSTAS